MGDSKNGIVGVAAAIVTVALVTTIVSRPESAKIVKAIADGFSGALRAAQGH
jgi:hypothetical protein